MGAGGGRRRQKERTKPKENTKTDIPTFKFQRASKLLPHLRFIQSAAVDACKKYKEFTTSKSFDALWSKFNDIRSKGLAEEDILSKADALGLTDDAGLIKMLFVVERRKNIVQLITMGCDKDLSFDDKDGEVTALSADDRAKNLEGLLNNDGYLQENAPSAQPYSMLTKGEAHFNGLISMVS